jgi:hydroxyacid-oxoacid transhydrogenase
MTGEKDTAFQISTSELRFGPGATHEIGMDLSDLQLERVMLLADPNLIELPPVQNVRKSLEAENVLYDLYVDIRIEPSDASFQNAIAFAQETDYDGFVAVGGGSTIDTAKVANLYSCYPDEFLAYVNPPLGQGKPVPGPLKPLIAVPTTAGTGSETTGVAIFDMKDIKAKTGIAHRRLKPTLGIVDPENTITLPPMVVAGPGLDVMCHALESFTTLPFSQRPRPERPSRRPAYQGANPISDIWSSRALQLVDEMLIRAVRSEDDIEARGQMLLAASYAGMGFGNAGVHLCHGMSYPISSCVRSYNPPGYPDDHPIVPHGISVTLPAPAVFRFTASANPERHLEAAGLLGADVSKASPDDAGEILADRILFFMQELGLPNGLAEIGYELGDVPELVAGTIPQDRVNKLSPRSFTEEDLTALFQESMVLW